MEERVFLPEVLLLKVLPYQLPLVRLPPKRQHLQRGAKLSYLLLPVMQRRRRSYYKKGTPDALVGADVGKQSDSLNGLA